MRIVADENVPLLEKFFSELGQIHTYPGRQIGPDQVKDADVLIVRSVTKVDKNLLENSRVRFVGTCTIGKDHVDGRYLREKNIGFASAPGCNANSVVEYVLSALSVIAEKKAVPLNRLSVGIVGYGNVGSLLAKRLKRLEVNCLVNDPPLAELNTDMAFVSLDEVLKCDVVTIHTPLTDTGPHPTKHLFSSPVLEQMSSKQVLINSGRGAVVDNEALLQKLIDEPEFLAILDVWENEPNINLELAKRVFLSSPHIAGYSLDGKVKGTEQVYQAVCQYFGLPIRCKAGQYMPEPPLAKMTFTSQAEAEWAMHTALRACYDIRHDHSLLQRTLHLPEAERGLAFDRLRKEYRLRREFSAVKVTLKNADAQTNGYFKALGFNLKQ